jgi:hypothetical protein
MAKLIGSALIESAMEKLSSTRTEEWLSNLINASRLNLSKGESSHVNQTIIHFKILNGIIITK